MRQVADALHCAHAQHIVHRDVKPSNVLIDAFDDVHVIDFGLATQLDQSSSLTATKEPLGSLPYMSPEATGGRHKQIQPHSDVYSMGATLYELLTGHPPFHGSTKAEMVWLICNAEPMPPRQHKDLKIPEPLETICLTCLAKEPKDRYPSARALMEDLDRFLEGRPIKARPIGRLTKLLRWCRRNSIAAAIILALMTFVTIMTPSAMSLAREQQATKRAQILQVNTNSASMVAGTVLSQLRALSDAVERSASDENLARALESGDVVSLGVFCESTYNFYEEPSHGLKLNGNSPFNAWFVLGTDGASKALYPTRNLLGRVYLWRDYFKGAWKLAEKRLHSTYISPAFKGEDDDLYKFAIAAPIYGRDGRPIGVLVASIATASYLGSLVVHDKDSVTVLSAPRGRERDTPLPASSHLILLHPDYERGEAIPIENEEVRKLDTASRIDELRLERPLALPPPDRVMSSDAYEDPVAIKYSQYAGRWLAGFAPVGNTGFVVIVQTREDTTLEPERKLGWRLSWWALISAAPGLLLILVAIWYTRKKRTSTLAQA